jgi:AbrB family looped-hinge helix DNA binding protein
MTTLITVSSKNQITIPIAMASQLGLEKGSKIWTTMKDNTIVLEKVEDSWDSLQGILANHPMSKKYSTLQVIEIAKKREAKRLGKKYERMLR